MYLPTILTFLILHAHALAFPTDGQTQDIASRSPNTQRSPSAIPRELLPRACTNNGCKCKKGTKQGQYCGNDGNWTYDVIKLGKGGKRTDVYECAPSGACCRYGPSKECIPPIG